MSHILLDREAICHEQQFAITSQVLVYQNQGSGSFWAPEVL